MGNPTTQTFLSFYTFSWMPQVKEIIVVCDPSYKDIFKCMDFKFLIVCVSAFCSQEKYGQQSNEHAFTFLIQIAISLGICADTKILLRFLRRCTLKVKDISCIGGYQRWCPRRYSEAVIKSEDATFSLVCPMSTC
ncbi:uncharacterized protein LOC132615113 isoform X2 [Lycium barbarum]|uniref:uncharacterized protein LOC132615113 isoform X2 n=1 Tax=Lycium barbarum TaxID=112863 RepID=UPI00293F4859|nr:uncharacterized protein LOC132615113 isoform X2 [Lycium barbarum]